MLSGTSSLTRWLRTTLVSSSPASTRYRFVPAVQLLSALLLNACSSEPSQSPSDSSIQFVEVARQAGIDFQHYNGSQGDYYYAETFGSGAAFFDYDGDGWQDIYLMNGAFLVGERPPSPPANRLYRNAGPDGFVDMTASTRAGHEGYGMGCAAGDYDNDGDQDLFITNYGPNAFLQNDGSGSFSDVTETAAVGDPRWGTSCGFLDFDRDGDLDLFAVNYVHSSPNRNPVCMQGEVRTYCEPTSYEPTLDILFRNDGDRFVDVSAEMGITLVGRGLGLALSDYDRDGDTDIYVANDGDMNFLYENRDGGFNDSGMQTWSSHNRQGRAEAGMGVDFGDFNNDGYQDLFVSNFSLETNTLYRNDGGAQFGDISDRLGLEAVSFMPLGFGAKFLDYDNDGDVDLFVANGHVLDQVAQLDSTLSYAQLNQMLRNDGGSRFTDVSAHLGSGFECVNVGRGAAAADYDNDGDVDLLVTSEAGRPSLLRNEGGNARHWLLIHLVGKHQRDALGSRVEVVAGGTRQVKERQSGGSYLSSHDPRLHFGLGEVTRADVKVHWPDGTTQSVTRVQADQILRVVQGRPQ